MGRFKINVKNYNDPPIFNAIMKRWWFQSLSGTQEIEYKFNLNMTRDFLPSISKKLEEGNECDFQSKSLIPDFKTLIRNLLEAISYSKSRRSGNEDRDGLKSIDKVASKKYKLSKKKKNKKTGQLNDMLTRNLNLGSPAIFRHNLDTINSSNEYSGPAFLTPQNKFTEVKRNKLGQKQGDSEEKNSEGLDSDEDKTVSMVSNENLQYIKFDHNENKLMSTIYFGIKNRKKLKLMRIMKSNEDRQKNFNIQRLLFDKPFFEEILVLQELTGKIFFIKHTDRKLTQINGEDVEFYNRLEGGERLADKFRLVQDLNNYCNLEDSIKMIELMPASFSFTTNNDYSFTDFVRSYYIQRAADGQCLWYIKCLELDGTTYFTRIVSDLKRMRALVVGSQIYKKQFVIQKYIENPLLFENRRIILKVYLLITWVNGHLKAFMYKEGFGYVDFMEYSPSMRDLVEERDKNKYMQSSGKKQPCSLPLEEKIGKYIISFKKMKDYLQEVYDENKLNEIQSRLSKKTSGVNLYQKTSNNASFQMKSKQGSNFMSMKKQNSRSISPKTSFKLNSSSSKINKDVSFKKSKNKESKSKSKSYGDTFIGDPVQSQPIFDHVMYRIKVRINKVEYINPNQKIARHIVTAEQERLNPENRRFSYQLFGMDFLLADNFYPWLIDVSSNPQLRYRCSIADYAVSSMIDNVFR